MSAPKLLYCHCKYAQVVPPEVKEAVLRMLCQSNTAFEAVADLCELSARRDPSLALMANGEPLKIAACFPRAVKWLFASAGAPLAISSTEIINMRALTAEAACSQLLATDLTPNLPTGAVTAADAPPAVQAAAPEPV